MKVDTHGYAVQIGVSHHKIHHGMLFSVSDIDTDVDVSGPKYWRLHTPAGINVHADIKVTADNDAVAVLYRAATVSGAGSALSVVNRNENSANVAATLAFKDTTVSSDGTLRETIRVATGTNNPNNGNSTGERGEEWELLPETDDTIKVTTGNDNTSVEIQISLYEEDH